MTPRNFKRTIERRERRLQRREALREIGMAELEDRFAPRQILEPVLAQRLGSDQRWQVIAAQVVRGF